LKSLILVRVQSFQIEYKSDCSKTAGISRKRAELLFRITHYFQPDSVLEIGTSLGLATAALSLGSQSVGIKKSQR
jgi:predicted O-methyltransferase YrrM